MNTNTTGSSSDRPILIPKEVSDAVKEYILAVNALHSTHGSTAVHGGIGGQAITAHCGFQCSHPLHQPELDRVYLALRKLVELGVV